QYLRISTTRVPDMRPNGIPDAVCSAIEHAMSIDPAQRPASAAEFGRELQSAQRLNGLKPDSMAITTVGGDSARTVGTSADLAAAPSVSPREHTAAMQPPDRTTSTIPKPAAHVADTGSAVAANAPSAAADQDEFSEAATKLRGGHIAETQGLAGTAAGTPEPS